MINVELSQKDMYDFNIKTVKTTKDVEGKKIIIKHKEAVFKRDDIFHQRVYRFDKPNAPDILKNIEIINAPFPFYKSGLNEEKYFGFDWSISTVIYAFKHGLIDGFYFQNDGLFAPVWKMFAKAYIVIDPLKRKEVHEYIEKEFKVFIEKCNDKDFEYGANVQTTYDSKRIGKRKDSSLDQILTEIKKERKESKDRGEEYYQTPNEIAGLKKYGEEKLDLALANMIYYTYDFGVGSFSEKNIDHLTFHSFQEADLFCAMFNEQSEIYGGEYIDEREIYKKIASPMIVNDAFDKSILNYYKNNYLDGPHKHQDKIANKLKGGSKMKFASGTHELTMK